MNAIPDLDKEKNPVSFGYANALKGFSFRE